MLTFHHSFSTRIFPDTATGQSGLARNVSLNRVKDSRQGRALAWILRAAQDDRRGDRSPQASTDKGGAHAR